MRWWWALCQLAFRVGGGALWRLRARGLEHVPLEGGVILAANHQSFLDPPLVAACVPREISFMARRSLFAIPLFRRVIAACNAFPIDRDAGDVRGIKNAIDRLKSGSALVMFPEGTRTRDGRIGRMKPGIRVIAARAGVPIVPVRLQGLYEVWPKGRPLPRLRGQVTITFGKPVRLEGSEAEFGRRLRDAVAGLASTGGQEGMSRYRRYGR